MSGCCWWRARAATLRAPSAPWRGSRAWASTAACGLRSAWWERRSIVRAAAGWRRGTATVAGTYALNIAIKQLIGRRRPELPGLPPLTSTPTALSFPSAHASTSFAGARCYARLGLPAPALYALAAGLSLSRLYLGALPLGRARGRGAGPGGRA